MWFLKKVDGDTYPLFTKGEHVIGRCGTLELSADQSVSRQHASIVIKLKNGKAKFILQDLGSKYGTYLNDGIESVTALPKITSIELKIGDRIRFGLQSNIWTMEESRFVTCTSMLSSRDKTNLKNILNRLNGDIVSDWNINCTHLTMTQIKTTIKVVCASAQVKPIVSLDYWKRLDTVFFGSVEAQLPDCDDFVPPLAEPQIKSSLINMKMNKNRRKIFEGFQFIVFNDAQIKNVLPVVEAAGGSVVDGNSVKINENELCREKVIVVQSCSSEDSSSKITRLIDILNSKGLRLIKETEIYLSIFECSTERHCNPKYDMNLLILPSLSQISVKDEASVLAGPTQELQSVQETQFLETASGNFSLAVNERIVFSDSDDDSIIPGTDPSIISGTPLDRATTKRKLDELESAVKAKNTRLESWLLNKKLDSKDSGESSASESIFSSSKMSTKGFTNLFSFHTTKKEGNGASNNLLRTNNDFNLQATSASKDKEILSSRSSKLFAIMTNKPSEPSDQKINRTDGLFTNISGSRGTRSFSNIFSSSEESTKNVSLCKRKRENEVDGECKLGYRTASLFEKRAKLSNTRKVANFDSDDDSETISVKTLKLADVNDTPVYQDSPVDIPSKMSLSQFQSASVKGNIRCIETEENRVKETTDRSIVCTMPLVLNETPNMQSSKTTNFKKFRKNEVRYPSLSTLNGTKLTLFSNGIENGLHHD